MSTFGNRFRWISVAVLSWSAVRSAEAFAGTPQGSAAKQQNHNDDQQEEADRASANIVDIGKNRREGEMHSLSFFLDGNSFAIRRWSEATRCAGLRLWGITLPWMIEGAARRPTQLQTRITK